MDNIAKIFSVMRGAIRIFVAVILLVTIYFLPTGVAMLRRKDNTVSIAVLNTFLGWTFIGWVFSLVWAVKSDGQKQVIVVRDEGKTA